jgi:hypothetical protein
MDGSSTHQVLSHGKIPEISSTSGTLTAHAEYSGACRLCAV